MSIERKLCPFRRRHWSSYTADKTDSYQSICLVTTLAGTRENSKRWRCNGKLLWKNNATPPPLRSVPQSRASTHTEQNEVSEKKHERRPLQKKTATLKMSWYPYSRLRPCPEDWTVNALAFERAGTKRLSDAVCLSFLQWAKWRPKRCRWSGRSRQPGSVRGLLYSRWKHEETYGVSEKRTNLLVDRSLKNSSIYSSIFLRCRRCVVFRQNFTIRCSLTRADNSMCSWQHRRIGKRLVPI